MEKDLLGRGFSQWCYVVSMETGITSCKMVALETRLVAQHRTIERGSQL